MRLEPPAHIPLDPKTTAAEARIDSAGIAPVAFPPVRPLEQRPGPATRPTRPAEAPRLVPVTPAEGVPGPGTAPGSVAMRTALSELVALWDALPDPTVEDRAALWAMRGELRRLRTLEAYLNGFLRG